MATRLQFVTALRTDSRRPANFALSFEEVREQMAKMAGQCFTERCGHAAEALLVRRLCRR